MLSYLLFQENNMVTIYNNSFALINLTLTYVVKIMIDHSSLQQCITLIVIKGLMYPDDLWGYASKNFSSYQILARQAHEERPD